MSCAKTSYLVEQGIGQIGLEWNGRSNEKVLSDKNVKAIHKDKIRTILKAKKYFYEYFGYKETDIYDCRYFFQYYCRQLGLQRPDLYKFLHSLGSYITDYSW